MPWTTEKTFFTTSLNHATTFSSNNIVSKPIKDNTEIFSSAELSNGTSHAVSSHLPLKRQSTIPRMTSVLPSSVKTMKYSAEFVPSTISPYLSLHTNSSSASITIIDLISSTISSPTSINISTNSKTFHEQSYLSSFHYSHRQKLDAGSSIVLPVGKTTNNFPFYTLDTNLSSNKEQYYANNNTELHSPALYTSMEKTTHHNVDNSEVEGDTSINSRDYFQVVIGVTLGFLAALVVIALLTWMWTRKSRRDKVAVEEDELTIIGKCVEDNNKYSGQVDRCSSTSFQDENSKEDCEDDIYVEDNFNALETVRLYP